MGRYMAGLHFLLDAVALITHERPRFRLSPHFFEPKPGALRRSLILPICSCTKGAKAAPVLTQLIQGNVLKHQIVARGLAMRAQGIQNDPVPTRSASPVLGRPHRGIRLHDL